MGILEYKVITFHLRESIERAKAKLVQQLTTAVRTTLAIEDTITSRLETLFEQTMREDDEETVSEVASLPDGDDSIQEGFRRRQAMLASSTPAAPTQARALGMFCINYSGGQKSESSQHVFFSQLICNTLSLNTALYVHTIAYLQ